jgi:Tol biopolymer transport system component
MKPSVPMNYWKVAAIAMAAGCAYLWFAGRQPVAADLIFAPLTSDAGLAASPAISADGQLAAYASDRDAKNLELYVQPVDGGPPVRLTHTAADESQPAFSPDAGSIAFRSETAGGGVYVMPVRGGDARLLAASGRDPRYSPDGRWIAYWNQTGAWMIPSAGGTPRQIFPALSALRNPIWSPDGKLVMARADGDFVVGPVGGKPVPAGILERTGRRYPDSPNWTSAGLFFVLRTGWVRNIWRVPLNAQGRAAGAALQITSGAESTGDLAVARDGRMVFTAGSQRFNVWALPLDANSGKVTGAPYRLTDGTAAIANPAISGDGRRLLYDAQRYGVQQLFLRELDAGQERTVASAPLGVSAGRFLPNGHIGYRERTQTGSDAVLLDTATGASRRIAAATHLWGVDSKEEIALVPAGDGVDAIQLKSQQRIPFLRASAGNPVSQAWFSPDGRWVVFVAGERIYRAPFHGFQPLERGAWVPVAAGDRPRFSPDGRLIYFTRDTSASRGIYAVRAEAQAEPFPVWEPSEPRMSLLAVNPAAFEFSIAPDKLVLLMAESNFNVWSASPRQ